MQISDFQQNHRIKLQKYLIEELFKLRKKYSLAKEEIVRNRRMLTEQQNDNNRLRMVIKVIHTINTFKFFNIILYCFYLF